MKAAVDDIYCPKGSRMRHSKPLCVPLFVPGHRPELLTKAAKSGADAVIMTLKMLYLRWTNQQRMKACLKYQIWLFRW